MIYVGILGYIKVKWLHSVNSIYQGILWPELEVFWYQSYNVLYSVFTGVSLLKLPMCKLQINVAFIFSFTEIIRARNCSREFKSKVLVLTIVSSWDYSINRANLSEKVYSMGFNGQQWYQWILAPHCEYFKSPLNSRNFFLWKLHLFFWVVQFFQQCI